MRCRTIPLEDVAPEIELPGIDGRTHRLADYRGRRVLLLFYRGHW